MINAAEIELLSNALAKLAEGQQGMPAFEPDLDIDKARDVLTRAAERMQDNYPYYHPLYAGQMLKPPHAVARLAYAMSLWVNPNNHALDGGRASSALEKECIIEIGRMVGWEAPLGHLTGGGTMANLEALWIAGRLNPGKRIVASSQAHYTHSRISDVLGLPFSALRADADGRIDLAHLEETLATGEVGTIVATMGTTGLGAVDPLRDILELAERYGARVHADAAYGGYFTLAGELDEPAHRAFASLSGVDSIVIDPHKHGLQPYGCGSVLFRDASVGRFYKHDSPYTYFSSADLHLGEISLECSRPGASAVALWATQQFLPLEKGGEFAAGLDKSLAAARDFRARLARSPSYEPLWHPQLDIVIYIPMARDATSASERSRRVFEAAARQNLHLSLISLPCDLVRPHLRDFEADADTVTCLRSVLMKPEHADWLGEIMQILESCDA